MEFSDRYDALGIPYPDPETMCEDQCEGTGRVPIFSDEKLVKDTGAVTISAGETEEPWHTLWLEAEAKEHADDGWHFVVCPSCKGTGKCVPNG